MSNNKKKIDSKLKAQILSEVLVFAEDLIEQKVKNSDETKIIKIKEKLKVL